VLEWCGEVRIEACIPSNSSHKIEIIYGRLKDWRHIHTRYDRCFHTFISAICITAAAIFWINQ
jgi:hypothetical protein